MDGTYKIKMSTPLGLQTGTLTLQNNNGELQGTIFAMGSETALKNGKANGNNFEFSGTLRTGFGVIEYYANGSVVGDDLQANAKTKFGILHINGKRV